MTKEQIENAAVATKESQNYHMSFEDAQDYISKCGFDIPWNDGDVFVDDREITRTIGNVLKWRINSVWHDSSVRPADDERCRNILVESKRGIESDRYDADYNELDSGTDWEMEVIRWAYIDDLLPERKEER